jgi:hypothetical protein
MSQIIEVTENPDGSRTAKGGSSITVVAVTCLNRQKAVTNLDAALSAIAGLAQQVDKAREALKMENQRIVPARFKCLACGEFHEGSGNLPCPKMTPYAEGQSQRTIEAIKDAGFLGSKS